MTPFVIFLTLFVAGVLCIVLGSMILWLALFLFGLTGFIVYMLCFAGGTHNP